MSARSAHYRSGSGFTLLELVVVMAIMGIAVAMIGPSLTLPPQRFDPDLVTFFKEARSHSLRTGTTVVVRYTKGQFWAEQEGLGRQGDKARLQDQDQYEHADNRRKTEREKNRNRPADWRDNRNAPSERMTEHRLPQGQRLALDWPETSAFLPSVRVTSFYPNGTGVWARFKIMRKRQDFGETEAYNVEIDPVHGEIIYAYP